MEFAGWSAGGVISFVWRRYSVFKPGNFCRVFFRNRMESDPPRNTVVKRGKEPGWPEKVCNNIVMKQEQRGWGVNMALIKTRLKLKQWYMDLGIRNKILLLNFSVIILIALIIGVFSYLIYAENIIQKISAVNLRDTRQVKNNLETLQQEIYELSTYLCLWDQIQAVLNQDDLSGIGLNEINKAMSPLSGFLAFKEAISFISIYGENGLMYYTSKDGSAGIGTLDSIKEDPIYREAVAQKGGPLWVTLNGNHPAFIQNNRNPKIAMFRSLLNMDTLEPQGFLMICINLAFLEDLCRKNIDYPESAILLINENQEMITAVSAGNTNLERQETVDMLLPFLGAPEGERILELNGDQLLLTYSTLPPNNWKVVYLVPTRIVLQPVKTILLVTTIVIMLCLAIGFVLSIWTSALVTKPINKLLSSMQRVKAGNFKEKVDFIYRDEIGRLGAQYNAMIDHIHRLINRVFKLQLKQKEAELRALQAQINPHFLYNTLDTIYWKAQKAGEEEISEMIYALAGLFRLTLNRGEDFITVDNEKKLIEHYILLQKKRFNDKLTYEIDFEAKILSYRIPKLILQPFVENAVIHGAENKEGATLIGVRGYYRAEKLHFSIEDNGVGIEPAVLTALRQGQFSNEKTEYGGFAIHNVKERLDLYYPGCYQLTINSQLGEGTQVQIVIPAGEKGVMACTN